MEFGALQQDWSFYPQENQENWIITIYDSNPFESNRKRQLILIMQILSLLYHLIVSWIILILECFMNLKKYKCNWCKWCDHKIDGVLHTFNHSLLPFSNTLVIFYQVQNIALNLQKCKFLIQNDIAENVMTKQTVSEGK